jgi:hypothetical protein
LLEKESYFGDRCFNGLKKELQSFLSAVSQVFLEMKMEKLLLFFKGICMTSHVKCFFVIHGLVVQKKI